MMITITTLNLLDILILVGFSSAVTAIVLTTYFYSRIKLMFRILGDTQKLLNYLSSHYDEDGYVRKITYEIQERVTEFLYRRKRG